MRRHGFTLVETLLVIVIMALVVGLAIPRLTAANTKRNLRGSKNTIVSLYSQARITAMQQVRTVGLRFEGNNVFIAGWPRQGPGAGDRDTIGSVRYLATEFGVTITPDHDSIIVDAKGFPADTLTVVTAKSGYADTVIISRYGRLLK